MEYQEKALLKWRFVNLRNGIEVGTGEYPPQFSERLVIASFLASQADEGNHYFKSVLEALRDFTMAEKEEALKVNAHHKLLKLTDHSKHPIFAAFHGRTKSGYAYFQLLIAVERGRIIDVTNIVADLFGYPHRERQDSWAIRTYQGPSEIGYHLSRVMNKLSGLSGTNMDNYRVMCF